MSSIKRVVIFLLIAAGMSFTGWSQDLDSLRIDLQVSKYSPLQILQRIESEYPVRFYFQPNLLPSQSFDLNVTQTPLPEVLDLLLRGTRLSYLPYRSYAVVIAPRESLGQEHDASYYTAWEETLTAEIQSEESEEGPFLIGDKDRPSATGKVRIEGRIRDVETGEILTEASILVPELRKGSNVNENGNFVLNLSIGTYDVQVQALGYERRDAQIIVFGNGKWIFR